MAEFVFRVGRGCQPQERNSRHNFAFTFKSPGWEAGRYGGSVRSFGPHALAITKRRNLTLFLTKLA
jgi:hypothetical protein